MTTKIFTLATGPLKIKWPVKMDVPVDGGGTVKREFLAIFLGETTEDQRSRWARMDEAVKSGDRIAGLKAEDELFEQVFVGWEGVADENGNPVEFNEETRDLMLGIEYRRDAILKAYKLFIEGKKAKN